MATHAKISGFPSLFRSSTTLEVNGFDYLYSKVEGAYPSCEGKRLSSDERKREVGAGHLLKLQLRESLLTLLIY